MLPAVAYKFAVFLAAVGVKLGIFEANWPTEVSLMAFPSIFYPKAVRSLTEGLILYQIQANKL